MKAFNLKLFISSRLSVAARHAPEAWDAPVSKRSTAAALDSNCPQVLEGGSTLRCFLQAATCSGGWWSGAKANPHNSILSICCAVTWVVAQWRHHAKGVAFI